MTQRTYDPLKKDIDHILAMPGLDTRMKERVVAEKLTEALLARGCLYQSDEQTFLFLTEKKVLLPIEVGDQIQLLLDTFGIMPSEHMAKTVIEYLHLAALRDGTKTQVYKFSHYDKNTSALYLFDGTGTLKITAAGIARVENGCDGVLFVSNTAWTPFVLGDLKPTSFSNMRRDVFGELLLDCVNFRAGDAEGSGLTIAETRELFSIWFFTLFFPELFPTKMILALIGEMGSGKTSILRRVGMLLFGPQYQVCSFDSEGEKDFDAALTNNHLLVVDNADGRSKTLCDKLAIAATGGVITKRVLYTTNKEAKFKISAFVGITSRTPDFRREDVAERSLILTLNKLGGRGGYTTEAQFIGETLRRRDALMTQVVGMLQQIVMALDKFKLKDYDIQFRMADFGRFALVIEDYWGGDVERMKAMLHKLTRKQQNFSSEDDVILEILATWVSLIGDDGRPNAGREVTVGQLHKGMMTTAMGMGVDFQYKAMGFAFYLRNKESTLKERFKMTERTLPSGNKHLRKFQIPVESETDATEALPVEEPSEIQI